MAQGKPWPMEVRKRVISLYNDGIEIENISQLVGVPAQTIRTWANRKQARIRLTQPMKWEIAEPSRGNPNQTDETKRIPC